jgi:hypothetical protein
MPGRQEKPLRLETSEELEVRLQNPSKVTPEELSGLDNKFITQPSPVVNNNDKERASAIISDLEKINPKVVSATDEVNRAKTESPSQKDYDNLALCYPDIKGKTYGEAEARIKSANEYLQFGQMDPIVIPAMALGIGGIVSQASLVPSFITALALGPTGVVTTAGVGIAAGVVLPVLAAAGYLAYSGYKMFKNWRTGKKVKKDLEVLDKAYFA